MTGCNTPAYILREVVFGHTRLPDGTMMHTTNIQTMEWGKADCGVYVAHTRDTIYTLHIRDVNNSVMQHFWAELKADTTLPDWLQQ